METNIMVKPSITSIDINGPGKGTSNMRTKSRIWVFNVTVVKKTPLTIPSKHATNLRRKEGTI